MSKLKYATTAILFIPANKNLLTLPDASTNLTSAMQKNNRLTSEVRREIGNQEIATTIISLVLDCSKSEALVIKEMPNRLAKKCIKIAHSHERGVPIAYATRKWYFYDLPMKVTRNVLVPRMDTEILVNTVLNEIKDTRIKTLKLLDLCTGSGCIAVALAKNLPAASVAASDISRTAIRIARTNARINNVRIDFRRGDLFGALGLFDVIVCNPPYIQTAQIGIHDSSTLREPRRALDGGADGLHFYRRIITDATKHMKPNGLLAFEIGHDQAVPVKELLRVGGYRDIKTYRDLNGLDRVVTARNGETCSNI